jgi:hypothetical protein
MLAATAASENILLGKTVTGASKKVQNSHKL